MPSSEKQVHVQTFTGGMDTVTAPQLMPNNTARYMLNCYTLSTGQGNVGIVTNVKGNTLISDTLPIGDNKCIGVVSNEENRKFYLFVWNSNGYHTIKQYDEVNNGIITIIENISDTGGIDVLRFSTDYLVLMGNIVRDNLLYWVDGLNDARKINVKKALDTSADGYGAVILEEFINAYKIAPIYAPTLAYTSDTTKKFNYIYGGLRKFAYRYRYDDGEWSDYSPFSAPSTPPFENFIGVNQIPTDNNCIQLSLYTGNRIVTQLEVVVWAPTQDVPEPNWQTVVNLDKKEMGIGNDTVYIYNFYNDGIYPTADQSKVVRPYSYLPKAPLCQEVAGGSIIYSNFNEGFENVNISTSIAVSYKDLFIDNGTEPELNSPFVSALPIPNMSDYMSAGGNYINVDGSIGFVPINRTYRSNAFEITIGNDVKKGNIFTVNFWNGVENYTYQYTATLSDTAETVAFQLKTQIVNSGLAIQRPSDSALPNYLIYNNIVDGFGNVKFRFWALSKANRSAYFNASSSVNPVNTETLKDTGQSVSNMKLGAGTKYGIVYYDFQGRRSLVYTNDGLNITTSTENALGGLKSPVVDITVSHTPPVWAKYWEIVRTSDLTFGSFLDILIQNVVDVRATNLDGEYLDLVIGSLYTYQQIHPNTVLKYQFTKGDRIRFKRKLDGTYYPDFETQILSYSDNTDEPIQSSVVIDGTTTVTVASALDGDVGKYIVIDGYERLIIDNPTSTTFLLNTPIGTSGTPRTVLGYNLIDRRGVLRIRKPNPSTGVVLDNNSLVEIFSPALGGTDLGDKQFYHFNKKFEVQHAGQANRYHLANLQNQTNSQPAIVQVTEGTVYVRNRELPLTNVIPNAQVTIMPVEDAGYSDFYYSSLNVNGRTNIEDNGIGVVHFGDRMRFSAIQIEDTQILGFNDFDNLNRKDYNDKYGDIMLTRASENQMLVFKEYKDCIVPIYQNIIQDAAGQDVLGVSKSLLNDIRYYSHDGGIGNNPESYCRNENNHYHVSPNSGCWIRLGGDGATPISKIYQFDNEARNIINTASANGAKIFGGFDPMLSQPIWSVEDYVTKTLSTGFNQSVFQTLSDAIPSDTPQTITVNPTHGTITYDMSGRPIYTPDADYVGTDSFEYETDFGGGNIVTRKVCITVGAIPVQQLGWRAKSSSGTCVLVDGVKNGYFEYTTLEQYNLLDGVATGTEKPNVPSDPNYVAPIYDATECLPAQWVINTDESYCEQEGDPIPQNYYLFAKLTQIPTGGFTGGTPNRGVSGEYCTTYYANGEWIVQLYKSTSNTSIVDGVLYADTADVVVRYNIVDTVMGNSIDNVGTFSFASADTVSQNINKSVYNCSIPSPLTFTRTSVLEIAYGGNTGGVGNGYEVFIKNL